MITPLETLWLTFNRAWNDYDARALSELFAEDSQFQFLDGRQITGRPDIETFYREVFAKLQNGLIHRATVEEERGSSGRGLVQIINTANNREVLLCRYELALLSTGLILSLKLSPTPSPRS